MSWGGNEAISGVSYFLINEGRAKPDLGELGLVVKRSETSSPCALCQLDGLYDFCRTHILKTYRIRKSDYYILVCRLELGNYLVSQLRSGLLVELAAILKEIEKQKAKSS